MSTHEQEQEKYPLFFQNKTNMTEKTVLENPDRYLDERNILIEAVRQMRKDGIYFKFRNPRYD